MIISLTTEKHCPRIFFSLTTYMGISFGRRPPEKFIGIWLNRDNVRMRIRENGNLDYSKEVS